MASVKKTTKKATPTATKQSPRASGTWQHQHHVGPIHVGTVTGEVLTTICGKELGAKYWRAFTGKATCASCVEMNGYRERVSAVKPVTKVKTLGPSAKVPTPESPVGT
jgi:hypothetical protein